MTEMVSPKKPKFARARVLLMTAAATGAGLVSTVSAGNITDGISPVITDVTELLPLMLNLVIAALPIIVALAVIGFLLGLFDGILSKIKL
jgi:hypothetical protein